MTTTEKLQNDVGILKLMCFFLFWETDLKRQYQKKSLGVERNKVAYLRHTVDG